MRRGRTKGIPENKQNQRIQNDPIAQRYPKVGQSKVESKAAPAGVVVRQCDVEKMDNPNGGEVERFGGRAVGNHAPWAEPPLVHLSGAFETRSLSLPGIFFPSSLVSSQ